MTGTETDIDPDSDAEERSMQKSKSTMKRRHPLCTPTYFRTSALVLTPPCRKPTARPLADPTLLLSSLLHPR